MIMPTLILLLFQVSITPLSSPPPRPPLAFPLTNDVCHETIEWDRTELFLSSFNLAAASLGTRCNSTPPGQGWKWNWSDQKNNLCWSSGFSQCWLLIVDVDYRLLFRSSVLSSLQWACKTSRRLKGLCREINIFIWRLKLLTGTFCTCSDGFYNFLFPCWWKNHTQSLCIFPTANERPTLEKINLSQRRELWGEFQ